MGRWYYVCDASDLDTVRETLPVVAGTPRSTKSGRKVMVRLSEHIEGALTHAEALKRVSRAAWKRDGPLSGLVSGDPE